MQMGSNAPTGAGGDWMAGVPKHAAMLVVAGLVVVSGWMLLDRESERARLGIGRAVSILDLTSGPRSGVAEGASRLPLNINEASQAELELLPGIGPGAAARIVEFREHAGGIRSIDELLNVRGIGRRTVERLRPLVTCGPVARDATLQSAGRE